jgi:hypothetical protein
MSGALSRAVADACAALRPMVAPDTAAEVGDVLAAAVPGPPVGPDPPSAPVPPADLHAADGGGTSRYRQPSWRRPTTRRSVH